LNACGVLGAIVFGTEIHFPIFVPSCDNLPLGGGSAALGFIRGKKNFAAEQEIER
jgi:hypothetical protein